MTPSASPVSGSRTGAPEHTQEWMRRLKCSAEKICTGWPIASAVPTPLVPAASSVHDRPGVKAIRSDIPAVTHVDYSARIQTVHADTNPRVHALLKRFEELTGCPILVNTSFNVRGEPIVATPEDAFRCFMGNELDLLVIGNCVLRKEAQDPALKADYSLAFEAD